MDTRCPLTEPSQTAPGRRPSLSEVLPSTELSSPCSDLSTTHACQQPATEKDTRQIRFLKSTLAYAFCLILFRWDKGPAYYSNLQHKTLFKGLKYTFSKEKTKVEACNSPTEAQTAVRILPRLFNHSLHTTVHWIHNGKAGGKKEIPQWVTTMSFTQLAYNTLNNRRYQHL